MIRPPPLQPASAEPLLWTFSEKMCHWTVLGSRLNRRLGQLQASWFSTPLIGSILNAIVKKRRTLDDHRPDVEFVYSSVASTLKIKNCLYSLAMTLLGITCIYKGYKRAWYTQDINISIHSLSKTALKPVVQLLQIQEVHLGPHMS